MKRRARVFLGLTEIAGYYAGLRRGFEALGCPVSFVNLSIHPFQYGGETENWIIRATIRSRARRLHSGRLLKPVWFALESLSMLGLFLWAAAQHDLFVFGFNSTFFRFYELPILRFLGKKIIYQYHGSDSRPPYLDRKAINDLGGASSEPFMREVKRRKRFVSRAERYATAAINIQPQGHFHEKPFYQWMRVGLPSRPSRTPDQIKYDPSANSKVVILHSPSNPEAKGTDRIRKSIEELIDSGLPIEYVEITGKPNSEVQAALEQCDLVVDQMFADYGMPGLATEASWFGRPTVIAGYAAEFWPKELPIEALPPTYYCLPGDFSDAVRRLVGDGELRKQLGAKARCFVETQWAPERVAERYLMIAYGDAPEEWLVNPCDIRYVHGCGLIEKDVRATVRELIEAHGVEALMLSDKPALERRFVEFAAEGKS